VILGEDELSAGQVKIKEMGLPEGHPEKEGVSVDIKNLVDEIKLRINKRNKGVETSTVIATDAVESATAAAAKLTVSGDAAAQKTEDAGV
jgi:histidyl-tRNA synthetase